MNDRRHSRGVCRVVCAERKSHSPRHRVACGCSINGCRASAWLARWCASDAEPFLPVRVRELPGVWPGEARVAGVDLRETQGIVVSSSPLTVIVSKGWEWLQMLYDVTCIDHASVLGLLQALTTCLREVAAAPHRPISELTRSA